jgi:Ca2+:H+ antiporter
MDRHRVLQRAPFLLPAVGVLVLVASWGRSLPTVGALSVGLVQVAVVAVAVIHAEEIAHRVGEPFGTLVLAVAVTVIEVALIVTLMATEPDTSASLARDTVFAAVMIVCNGIVGMALLLSARNARLVRFSEQGANALLGTVMTLAGLSLVMPTFTESSEGPTFSGSQLAFAAVSSTVVYGIFVFVQTMRHRWMFLSPESGELQVDEELAALNAGAEERASGERSLLPSVLALVVSLAVVVGLAKTLSKPIEQAVAWAGAPQSFVGVVIALMVLMPESVAAFRAASRGEMQTSLNLALGSALASIGLTIPLFAAFIFLAVVP